jgi:hypothetical protein
MSPLSRLVLAAALLPLAQAALAAKGAEPLDPAQAGVPVYPGAKADAGTTDFVRTSLGMSGAAFRTGDEVGKVVAFYGKQAGVKPMAEANKEGGAFLAGCKDEYNAVLKKAMARCNLQVTVQNPWMDMKTGKLVNATLITIVRQK